MPNYSVLWDETTPPGSEVKSLGDNRIREFKAQLRERLNTEHANISGSSGDAKLIHLPGKTSALYYGTTAQINALTGMSEGAIAFDTSVGALKIYTSSAWTVLPFDWDGMWGAGDAVHNHTSNAEGGVLTLTGQTLKFLATPTNKISWTAATDWTDVDISADTGTDTAKAALLNVTLRNAYGWGLSTGYFRKNGSAITANLPRVINSGGHSAVAVEFGGATTIIVECDASEIFETKLVRDTGSGDLTYVVDLTGYFI